MTIHRFWIEQLESIKKSFEAIDDQESILRVRLARGEQIATDQEVLDRQREDLTKEMAAIEVELEKSLEKEKQKEDVTESK